MKTWSNKINIQNHFQRSARIDTVLKTDDALKDFILQVTGQQILERMFDQVKSGEQRAFTWTGPYGSGKSSLARFAIEYLSRAPDQRKALKTSARKAAFKKFETLLSNKNGPWLVVRVAGNQSDLSTLIEDAILLAVGKYAPKSTTSITTILENPRQGAIIKALRACAELAHKKQGGLLVVIDELGKVLEHASRTGGDLHLLQEIAEVFGESPHTALFLGILHQSFAEYAGRIDHRAREEWAKIQGRFEDVPFSISIEESLALTARAINGSPDKTYAAKVAKKLVAAIENDRFRGNENLASHLSDCFPLHPLSALILSLASRLKFGQNERSIFSFLASKEPQGFKSFLDHTPPYEKHTYNVDNLFDYLQLNLGQSILASPLGHAWAEIIEASERARRGNELHQKVLKCVALVNVVGRPFGIRANAQIALGAFPEDGISEIEAALKDLEEWSILVHRRFDDSYTISEGSDLDIERELEHVRNKIQSDQHAILDSIPAVEPIIAKKHYHKTGTLRWFDVKFVLGSELELATPHIQADKSDGIFLIAIPETGNWTEQKLSLVSKGLLTSENRPVLVGSSNSATQLTELSLEVSALSYLANHLAELQTDKVARREVNARIFEAKAKLVKAQKRILNEVSWYYNGVRVAVPNTTNLPSQIASQVADQAYEKCPHIQNELLNRHKPSSQAIKARRNLMAAMAEHADKDKFGMEKYAAEVGIYMSILQVNELHDRTSGMSEKFELKRPSTTGQSKSFVDAFGEFDLLVEKTEESHKPFSLSELYQVWEAPPYGLRRGVLPLLALAYILTRNDELAIYFEKNFEPAIDDFLIEKISRTPEDVYLRLVSIRGVTNMVMQKLAEFTKEQMGVENVTTALDAARQFVQFAHRLPSWVQRTERLRVNTKAVRNILLTGNDPHALLFDALPNACGFSKGIESPEDIARYLDELRSAHAELRSAYDLLKSEVRTATLDAFGINPNDDCAIQTLRESAQEVIRQGGDLQLDAALARLDSALSESDIFESLASLITLKSMNNWIDDDVTKFHRGILDLAKRFKNVKSFVFDRAGSGKSTGIGFFASGKNLRSADFSYVPLSLTELEMKKANAFVSRLKECMSEADLGKDAKVAAVANLLGELLYEQEPIAAELKKGAA